MSWDLQFLKVPTQTVSKETFSAMLEALDPNNPRIPFSPSEETRIIKALKKALPGFVKKEHKTESGRYVTLDMRKPHATYNVHISDGEVSIGVPYWPSNFDFTECQYHIDVIIYILLKDFGLVGRNPQEGEFLELRKPEKPKTKKKVRNGA